MASRREDLERLRERLWAELENTAETPARERGESPEERFVPLPRDIATISKELRAIWVELEGLPVPGSKAPADEIARRREERRRMAAGE